MFRYAYIYMEAVAACNVSIDDMLKDEDFKTIREWDDYVEWKKAYYRGCRDDGYLLSQKDWNKPQTRDPKHWPKNAFVSVFASAVGVDDSHAETLEEQVACFGKADWPTVYYATEMFFHDTPVDLIRNALAKSDPVSSVKALFDSEFRLWEAFKKAKGLQRLTDMTAAPLAEHARKVLGDVVIVFSRDDESLDAVKVAASDDDDARGAAKRKQCVKRGSAARPAKKAKL